ncbi:Ff.00g089810.m01.CDS01 [Fusarium sp. VM40]|nr:Ff.00g089810.m01.CDS01 [Fusarium sp. VM40]
MPFTIAGVLAIFLPETQFDAFLKSYESPRSWERIKYPVDMEVQSLITEEQVLELAKQFPDCLTISQIGPDIWLQFPKVKTKSNALVLKVNSVDEATYRVPWGLARCNGQVLPKAPSMRTLSKAWPSKTHGSKPFAQSNTEEFPRLSSSIDRSKSMFKSDRSISNKVKLEPEDIVTLNRTTKMLAGILVERKSKRAVMFPAVSDLDDLKTKESRLQLARLGSGTLHNRIQNRNLSICPNPQFGQQCVMNTPTTGRRFLYRAGKQFDIKKTGPSKTRPPHLSGIKFGPEATQSDPEHSIHFERGIYFTNTPVTLQDFETKDPSFGRLITVCEKINEAVAPTSTPIQVSGLTSGFTDLWSSNPVSDFRNYMVYGEELSSLLDRGWTVVEAE